MDKNDIYIISVIMYFLAIAFLGSWVTQKSKKGGALFKLSSVYHVVLLGLLFVANAAIMVFLLWRHMYTHYPASFDFKYIVLFVSFFATVQLFVKVVYEINKGFIHQTFER